MAPKDLKALIRAYHKARGERNWESALDALDKASQACGGDAPEEWRRWTVEVAMLAGKWALARRASHPENQYSADAFTLQVLVSFLSCALVKATGEVQRALELSPSHKDALQLLQRIKRVQELRSLGNEAYNTGRLLEAIQKFTEGLGPIGESESEGMGGIIRANLLLNRALSLYRLKRYEEAVKDCNACLLLEPDAFKALRTRARSRRALRLYEASMEDYEAAYQYTSTQAERDLLREEANAVLNLLAESIRKDYYKILGVSEGCPEADIRKAYRAQALAHHPDKGGDEELFKLIGEAYAVLSEPPARSRYDAEKPIPRKFSPKEPAIPREGDAHAGGQAPKESGKKEKATASSTAPKPGSAAKTPASPHKDDSKDEPKKKSKPQSSGPSKPKPTNASTHSKTSSTTNKKSFNRGPPSVSPSIPHTPLHWLPPDPLYFPPAPTLPSVIFVNGPAVNALHVLPGDPRIGGIPCWMCGGLGVETFLFVFEEKCSMCNGIGRLL